MKVQTVYAVVPLSVVNGHDTLCCAATTKYDTYDEAIEGATHRVNRQHDTGMVIYQAVALVQETEAPVEVIQIGGKGEASCRSS